MTPLIFSKNCLKGAVNWNSPETLFWHAYAFTFFLCLETTVSPTTTPSNFPSVVPTISPPSTTPTTMPSDNPTTTAPTLYPSTSLPTVLPSLSPSTPMPSTEPSKPLFLLLFFWAVVWDLSWPSWKWKENFCYIDFLLKTRWSIF